MPASEQTASGSVIERLTRVEVLLTSLTSRLYGENNQPGDVQEIKSKVETLRAWRWKVAGGTAVVGILLTVVIQLAERLIVRGG